MVKRIVSVFRRLPARVVVGALAMAVFLVGFGFQVTRAADPTDAAGVTSAVTTFIAGYNMYILAGLILGLSVFLIRRLIRAGR